MRILFTGIFRRYFAGNFFVATTFGGWSKPMVPEGGRRTVTHFPERGYKTTSLFLERGRG
jgi:hypothetical protein